MNASTMATPVVREDGVQTGKRLASMTAAGSGLRPRKSTAPDIGTPIKLASASPYRTPESTSKVSLFLSKTPFGTPAKSNGTTLAPSVKPNAAQPLKPVPGFWPEVCALAKSMIDSNAYTTFALQPRPHLPYSGFLTAALRVNWIKWALITLAAHHVLFVAALFTPTHPLQAITLPVRPTVVLLSLLSYVSILVLLALIPGQPFSVTGKKWKNPTGQEAGEERIIGFTFSTGSPINLAVKVFRRQAIWRGVLLHATIALSIAGAHTLALMHYHQDSNWSPYVRVPIRLAQGYKTTALRPNERFWFLLSCNTVLGASYALLRALTSMRNTRGTAAPFASPRFEAQSSFESSLTRLSNRFRSSVAQVVVAGAAAPMAILQVYLVIRRPIFRLILSLIGHHSSFRPLIIPSFKRSLLSIDLLYRASLLGACTVLVLEIFNVGWEVYATQPVSMTTGGLSKFSREPTKCLIRGMQSRRIALAEEAHLGIPERTYYAHFAFAEMASVVATDAERRKAIFRDVANMSSTGGQEHGRQSAWAVIAQECISVLQEERQSVQARGAAVLSSKAKADANPNRTHLKPVDPAHQVKFESGTGVKNSKPGIWDRLVSSSPSSVNKPALPAPSSSLSTAQTQAKNGEDLDALLHRIAPPAFPAESQPLRPSISAPAPSSPSVGQAQSPLTLFDMLATVLEGAFGLLRSLFALLPSDLQHVLRNSFVGRRLISAHAWLFNASNGSLLEGGVVPHDEALATWSVQTLASLLSASLVQDEYGTVALASKAGLGIDDVMEEFALLLLALQRFGFDVSREVEGRGSQASAISALFDASIAPTIVTLRASMTMILSAFEPTDYRLRESTRVKVDEALRISQSSQRN